MRHSKADRKEVGPHSITLLVDRDHYACVTTARDLAKNRIVIGCDLFGIAADTSVLVPMGRAAELGRRVELYYHRPSRTLDGTDTDKHLLDIMPPGVSLSRIPNLHGKFLWWDTENVAVTSFNWLATVSADARARGAEFGLLISGPELVEKLEAKLEPFIKPDFRN